MEMFVLFSFSVGQKMEYAGVKQEFFSDLSPFQYTRQGLIWA